MNNINAEDTIEFAIPSQILEIKSLLLYIDYKCVTEWNKVAVFDVSFRIWLIPKKKKLSAFLFVSNRDTSYLLGFVIHKICVSLPGKILLHVIQRIHFIQFGLPLLINVAFFPERRICFIYENTNNTWCPQSLEQRGIQFTLQNLNILHFRFLLRTLKCSFAFSFIFNNKWTHHCADDVNRHFICFNSVLRHPGA